MKYSLKPIFLMSAVIIAGSIGAQNIEITNLTYRGPIEVVKPLMVDSVDISNKGFSETAIIDSPVNYRLLPAAQGDSVMVFDGTGNQIHFLSFPLRNERYADINLDVSGVKPYKIYLDGKETTGKLKLKPGSREVTVKFLTKGGENDTVRITASSPQAGYISTEWPNAKRAFTLEDVIYADHISGVEVSPSGKFALVSYNRTIPDNSSKREKKLISLPDGKNLSAVSTGSTWFEGKDLIRNLVNETDGSRSLMALDPVTMEESVFATNVPKGRYIVSPTNDFLIFITETEGPKEDKDIYRVLNPEDRQEGYRSRQGIALYDLHTGEYRPLTFGNKNIFLQDISPDGRKLLLMSNRQRFEKRPTSVFTLFEMNLEDMKADTLVFEDGFIAGAQYSPDGSMIAITGSPEALGGVGKNVPEGRIPSMTDNQLYLMDLNTKQVKPVTKDFNPSVEDYGWQNSSGNLFFTAEDKDKISMFEYNPKTGQITALNLPEEIIKGFSFASDNLSGAFIGESADNPEILYALEFKKGKPVASPLQNTGKRLLQEVNLAEVTGWDFVNSVGDTINGRFYLPPNFDPEKKYPLIVNYYGGCSPTSRNFATRYPHHVYANNGYVVYVINPSGATGFGQEFSSRHVNTAGEGVAIDIIEGTQKFLEEHPYIDETKIGCIGASYGGFMTQYLQTVTDLFAAAVSHAGISDHTSYWGNGYWGYSYSEVSMADSYPWSDPDLYVKQSPLYNADKINTPILFVHGDSDTNVPPGESIQLFTALKLLGKDTALVEVADQDHHILEPEKRKKWQDTIFAWFAKYLQDDPSWWDDLYPPVP